MGTLPLIFARAQLSTHYLAGASPVGVSAKAQLNMQTIQINRPSGYTRGKNVTDVRFKRIVPKGNHMAWFKA